MEKHLQHLIEENSREIKRLKKHIRRLEKKVEYLETRQSDNNNNPNLFFNESPPSNETPQSVTEIPNRFRETYLLQKQREEQEELEKQQRIERLRKKRKLEEEEEKNRRELRRQKNLNRTWSITDIPNRYKDAYQLQKEKELEEEQKRKLEEEERKRRRELEEEEEKKRRELRRKMNRIQALMQLDKRSEEMEKKLKSD